MSAAILPVIVHRWFDRGEGWAFHPSLRPSLMRIIKTVEPRLTMRSQERFICDFDDGQLVCDIFPDATCQNKQAVDRNPFVLRVAYSKRKLSKCKTAEVYDRLNAMASPEGEGADGQLAIRLSKEFANGPAAIGTVRDLAHNDRLGSTKFVGPWWPLWSILGTLAWLMVSVAYSLLSGSWDLARCLMDLTLAFWLVGTLHFVRHSISAKEDVVPPPVVCESGTLETRDPAIHNRYDG